jgi:creatinine amidohydrolase/Fe(II)-dependent formamide hydrolase-like protein
VTALAERSTADIATTRPIVVVPLRSCEPHGPHPLQDIVGELRRVGVGAVSPTGVLGDPTDATLEAGRNLLEMLTDDRVAAVDEARNTW